MFLLMFEDFILQMNLDLCGFFAIYRSRICNQFFPRRIFCQSWIGYLQVLVSNKQNIIQINQPKLHQESVNFHRKILFDSFNPLKVVRQILNLRSKFGYHYLSLTVQRFHLNKYYTVQMHSCEGYINIVNTESSQIFKSF